MKIRLLCVLVVIVSATLSAPGSAETFRGEDSNRVDACKKAKDLGLLRMESKSSSSTILLGAKNKLSAGTCDCSEDTKSPVQSSRWICTVDVDITGTEIPYRPGSSSGSNRSGGTEVRTDSAQGSSQIEACNDVKDNAAFAVRQLGGTVKGVSSCNCQTTTSSLSMNHWQCMVETTFQR